MGGGAQKEEEKREDYTHQYRGKGRQKIQDANAYLYVAINDKFEDKKPEVSIIEGWTLFNINSLDDELFVNHIKQHKWDTLVISTYGNRGDIEVDNAFNITNNIEEIEERDGGWFRFSIPSYGSSKGIVKVTPNIVMPTMNGQKLSFTKSYLNNLSIDSYGIVIEVPF